MSRSNHKSKAKSKKASASAASTHVATADADIQKMFSWASNNSGTIHPSIQIKKRASGGYGLFTKTSLSENTKVVRLMQASTYSVLTLHVIKQFVLDKAVYKADWARTRGIFDACVGDVDADDGGINDGSVVVIIRNYMWAFCVGLAMVKSKREAPISELEMYIKVLLQTPILDVDTSFRSEDPLINSLIRNKELVRGHYEKLVKMKPEVKAAMSFETAFQLHQAICCKVMRIPDSTSPDVNRALIPFIDIAQHHSTEFNAEFASFPLDHDPSKRILALFLKRNVKAGQEICVFNTTNDVCRSMETRGYIPQEPRTLSWSIPGWKSVIGEAIGEASVETKAIEMMALWLKVKPEIPLEQEKAGYVVLDEASFKLPLLLIPGLKYHRKGAHRFFPGTTDAEFDTTDDAQLYKKIEAEAGATAYGVLFENTPVQLHDILKQTGTDSKSKTDDLAKRTTDLLFSLGSRPRARENFRGMKLQSTYNGVLEQYEAEKEVMLTKFFATPYDEMLRMVRRSIQNYQYEEEMERVSF